MQNLISLLKFSISSEILAPVILISVYVIFLIVARGVLPTSEELINHFSLWYQQYGYAIIFFGSFLESLVLVNFFVPGAIAVAMGAVFARSGQLDLTLAVLAASAGAILGFALDFVLGYFGFGQIVKKVGYGSALSQAKNQINKSGVKAFSLGFIHPNIGSLISLAAGTLEMNALKFLGLSAVSTVTWISFWGLLVFTFGEAFLIILSRYAFVVILFILAIWLMSTLYSKRS